MPASGMGGMESISRADQIFHACQRLATIANLMCGP